MFIGIYWLYTNKIDDYGYYLSNYKNVINLLILWSISNSIEWWFVYTLESYYTCIQIHMWLYN